MNFAFPRSTIPGQIRRARRKLGQELDPKIQSKPITRKFVPQSPVSFETAEREWNAWFMARGWKPFSYQKQAWHAFRQGHSGLIVLPTGSGKTFSALGGPLMALREEGTAKRTDEIRVIYLTPLKALVRDLEKAVSEALTDLGWGFRVETRTGDTSAGQRRRQNDQLPHILFTTPESLALMITQLDWKDKMRGLEAIIIDEWHELLGSKRGSLLELTLARLRAAAPRAKTWAVSATLSDIALAAQVATGRAIDFLNPSESVKLIEGDVAREVLIDTIFPKLEGDLPWCGHSGLRRVPEVAAELNSAKTTMIFTNTRSQAEKWHSALLSLRPDWENSLALHHGSLDRGERERVESGVKEGSIPFVVATTSLDLGVDFPTVEKVIQIGSVKGVSRAIQRAGRAFHRPGEKTRLTVCPTHFLEYVEIAALRRAIAQGKLEARAPRPAPLDVLVQFVLSSALGEGFTPKELLRVVRSAFSFRGISDEDFRWVLNFVTTGGHTLRAYPQFQKLVVNESGQYRFSNPKSARLHRFNIGTIVGDAGVQVKFMRGAAVGKIDEGFITQLKPGDVFRFGGKTLELVHIRDLTAYVKISRGKETVATVWGGNALPISPSLSHEMREILHEVASALKKGDENLESLSPEVQVLRKIFSIQNRKSSIPEKGQTLLERLDTREGHHLFAYTWEGRAVNEGLGHLLAHRLTRLSRNTIAVSANDHGFECLGTKPFPDDEEIRRLFQANDSLETEIESSVNFSEMAKRAFREIARISGLIQLGPPHDRKSTRNLQMSASLLFDVFRAHDPGHPLLLESFREVKRAQLDLPRLKRVLGEISAGALRIEHPRGLTPFSFPLYLERIRSRLSTEALSDRIERLQKKVFAP